MSNALRNDPAKGRYELEVDGAIAVVDYLRRGDTLLITHTGVPAALQGRGIGSRLVKAVLDDIRGQGLKVVPHCSFVADYMSRHPEERDLLADDAD